MKRNVLLFFGLVVLIVLAGTVYGVQNSFSSIGSSDKDFMLTVEVRDGWNLLQGFISPDFISVESGVSASNVKAIFMYNPDENEYIELYPELKNKKDFFTGNDEYFARNLGLYSYWVYLDGVDSTKTITYTFKIAGLRSAGGDLENIPMKKGWNFVGVNPTFLKDGYFSWDAIKNDCVYEKIYYWSPYEMEWFYLNSNEQVKSYDFDDFLGQGMLVKVENECTIKSFDNTEAPPVLPLPGEALDASDKTRCATGSLYNPYIEDCVSGTVFCEMDKDCLLLETQVASFPGEDLSFTLISADEGADGDSSIIYIGELGQIELGGNQDSVIIFKNYSIGFESSDGDKNKIMGASFEVSRI